MYRPIRFIPDDTKIPFIKLSRFGFMISGALCVASILLFIFVGLNYGVDFKGGTNIIVRPAAGTEINALRETVGGIGFEGAELQNFGKDGDILIRLPIIEGSEHGQQETVDKLKAGLGSGVEILSVDFGRSQGVGRTDPARHSRRRRRHSLHSWLRVDALRMAVRHRRRCFASP